MITSTGSPHPPADAAPPDWVVSDVILFVGGAEVVHIPDLPPVNRSRHA